MNELVLYDSPTNPIGFNGSSIVPRVRNLAICTIASGQAMVLATAVQARPDRDHFRVSNVCRTLRRVVCFPCEVHETTVVTQLDMW
jgi:hypothetical protein